MGGMLSGGMGRGFRDRPQRQSGTGGPSLQSPGQGWGGGAKMGSPRIRQMRSRGLGQKARPTSTRRDIQGMDKGFAPAPAPGGSTVGRRARRQRMRQMGRPQPPQATTAPPAENLPNPYAGTPYEGITEGSQYTPQEPVSPSPEIGGFGGGFKRPMPVQKPFRQWGGLQDAPQLQGPASGMDFGRGVDSLEAGGFGGPQPMAPPPGPGAEMAPMGGVDPRRFGRRGQGGWGGALNLGG